MADADAAAKERIRQQWDIPGLLSDLRSQKWTQSEPGRIDRMAYISPYRVVEELALALTSPEDAEEAVKEGFEHEIVDRYLDLLSEVLMDATGRDLRREHIYATIENDDVFIGQYEDISGEELRDMGFEISGPMMGQARPKKRIPIARARRIAAKVERKLKPLAEELILVGSIRRRRREIGDIEFVVLPEGWERGVPELEAFADVLSRFGYAVGPAIRKATRTLQGVKVEIYIAHKPEEMGGLVFMYTGDFQFNIAMRRKAKLMGYRLNQYGIFDQDGEAVLQSPDEEDFFRFLSVPYHSPEERSVATRTPEEKRRRAQAKRKGPGKKKRGKRRAPKMGEIDPGIFGRMSAVWGDGAGEEE